MCTESMNDATEKKTHDRIGMYMGENENDAPSNVLYVNEFVLHSLSRFYQGMSSFHTQTTQKKDAQHNIPEDVRHMIWIPPYITTNPR